MLTHYHENRQWDKQMGIERLAYFKLLFEYTQYEHIHHPWQYLSTYS